MSDESTMRRFLAKLREIIRGKVKDGDLSESDFNEAVKTARSHVGGSIRWEKAREAANEELNKMSEWAQAFAGEIELAEDKSSGKVQIFPPVGTYTHPRYGKLPVTQAFLEQIKKNFDSKIYQQDLPMTTDLEHQSKLSGASGWIQDVEIRGDRGMWATVGLNDRGKALISDESYKYFSPEFYEKWTDPATNVEYTNVLIGGALTVRPFFKGMDPVVMAGENIQLGEFIFADGDDDTDEDVDITDYEPTEEELQAVGEVLTELGADPKEFAGDIGNIISTFGKWARGKHRGCVAQLAGKKGISDPARLCAWLKDRATGTTKWRGQKHVEGAEGDMDMMSMMKQMLGMIDDMKPEDMAECSDMLGKMRTKMDSITTKSKEGGEPVGMTEEEAKKFAEMETQFKSMTEKIEAADEARKAAEAEAKKANERVENLEREGKRRELREFVKANRLAFQGEVEEAVDRLERYSTSLSEADFTTYLDERKTLHGQIRDSAIMEEKSRNTIKPTSSEGSFMSEVRKAMAEDSNLSEPDAVAKIASEKPALYSQYDREFKSRIRKGGE